jgi:TRAP-type C4-dicarboxylate transport system substrate-binding protein
VPDKTTGISDSSYKGDWKLAHSFAADTAPGKMIQALADEIRDRTEGRINVTVYPAGVLGGGWVEYEMLMRGTIQMYAGGEIATYDPRLNIAYYMPYLFKDMEEARSGYGPGGWINEMLDPLQAGVGVQNLAVFPMGMAGLSVKNVPASPGDPSVPKNVKIRVMPIKACELTYKALGYLPVAMPYVDIYSGIDTGIIEGQMGGGPFQATMFKDVQGAFIQYNDYAEVQSFNINRELFASLSSGDQAILIDAARRQADAYWEIAKEEDERYRKMLRDYGLKVIMLTDAELEACATKVRAEVWPALESVVGKALVDVCRVNVGIPVT